MSETGLGFVEVRDEPRHRHRFATAQVSVYDVLLVPGDTTLYHRHREDTLYVAIAGATVRRQVYGDEATDTGPTAASGVCYCSAFREQHLIHRLTNVDEHPMRMVGAEVLAAAPAVASGPFEAPGHALLWETDRLRAYELVLGPEERTGPVDYAFSGLTVAVTEASLLVASGGREHIVVVGPGDLLWHDGPRSTALVNVGAAPYRAVVAEWR